MSDTTPDVERYLDARFAALSPGQRIEMACGMFSTAVALARAGILAAEPSLAEPEVRVRLLYRLYADDIPAEMLTAIVEKLRAHSKS